MICDKCQYDFEAGPMGAWPFCKGNQQDHLPGKSYVIGDECDILMKNGLCHSDGTPKRYTSKEAIKRDSQAAGLTNYVRHIGAPGSDKSKHTTRWI